MSNHPRDISDGHIRPMLAYLGPEGTYTHQAAIQRFGEQVSYKERDTIADVYSAIPSQATYAVIPKENSIYGPVIETYDLLRGEEAGTSKFIREVITVEIKHCLVVRRDVKLEDVHRIVSHEQALGQCTTFLSQMPNHVSIVKTSSTASAARSLLDENDISRTSAAICSRICTTLFPKLEVLYDSIQNEEANYTSFWLLSPSPDTRIPSMESHPLIDRHLLLRVEPPVHTQSHFDISSIFRAYDLIILRIDRRPSLNPMPFHDTYYVEALQTLESTGMCSSHSNVHDPLQGWDREVSDVMDKITRLGCEIKLLGSWH